MKLEATDWVMLLSDAFSREEQQRAGRTLLYSRNDIFIYIYITSMKLTSGE